MIIFLSCVKKAHYSAILSFSKLDCEGITIIRKATVLFMFNSMPTCELCHSKVCIYPKNKINI